APGGLTVLNRSRELLNGKRNGGPTFRLFLVLLLDAQGEGACHARIHEKQPRPTIRIDRICVKLQFLRDLTHHPTIEMIEERTSPANLSQLVGCKDIALDMIGI